MATSTMCSALSSTVTKKVAPMSASAAPTMTTSQTTVGSELCVAWIRARRASEASGELPEGLGVDHLVREVGGLEVAEQDVQVRRSAPWPPRGAGRPAARAIRSSATARA